MGDPQRAGDQDRDAYFANGDRLLEAAHARLAEQADDETLALISNAVLAIKDKAATFGADHAGTLAVEIDKLVDMMKSGAVTGTPDVVGLLARATAVLRTVLATARESSE